MRYEVIFTAPNLQTAFAVRDLLYKKYRRGITGSGSDPRQKGDYDYSLYVRDTKTKNAILGFLKRLGKKRVVTDVEVKGE